MKIKTAEILCVGTELLLGEVVNTNAAYISRELAKLGISVYHSTMVGDNPTRLAEAVKAAISSADLLIMSGGLGPTYDDLTKETVADALGLPMIRDEKILLEIENYFASTGRIAPPNNAKQADIPKGAIALPNRTGTAPGIFIEKDKPLSRAEVEEKIEMLKVAVEEAKDELCSDIIKKAMKKAVPTYHDPEEVNKDADSSKEMAMA